MTPGAPAARGGQAIASAWSSMLSATGVSLTFTPAEIVVSKAGDMAYDIGVDTLNSPGLDGGAVTDNGKYVVVCTREDGSWKVAADILNSNGAQ